MELDWSSTPWGEISLRRRRDPVSGEDVFEVKLGDEYLMSSQFTVAEIELARLALAGLQREHLSVMVAGLGLGYTADTALADPRTQSLVVIEALAPVIDWHRRGLLPDTAGLATDARTRLVEDDFFALVREERWPHPVDALLVDIDHSPSHHLRADHRDFYTTEGMRRAARMLTTRGCLGLWSDDPPDADMATLMSQAFESVDPVVVDFANSLTGGRSANTVYLARGPRPA